MTTLYVKDVFGDYAPAEPELIIAEAKRRLALKFRRGSALTSPNAARGAIQLKIAQYEHEVFLCVQLDKCAVHRYVQRHRRRQYGSGPLRCLLNINDDGAVTLKHPISGFFGGHHAQPTLPSLLLL